MNTPGPVAFERVMKRFGFQQLIGELWIGSSCQDIVEDKHESIGRYVAMYGGNIIY